MGGGMSEITLPAYYLELSRQERYNVRLEYINIQGGKCFYCKELLSENPPEHITEKSIKWYLFPKEFLKHPIHLQHNHKNGLTEGAVHSLCNAVLWQYHGR